MTETTTLGVFAKEILTRITGDNAEVKACKIARYCNSTVKANIAGLEGEIVDHEMAVEEAEEGYKNALYPSEMPSSKEVYLERILEAHNNWEYAKEELKNLQDSIEFFKQLYKEQINK